MFFKLFLLTIISLVQSIPWWSTTSRRCGELEDVRQNITLLGGHTPLCLENKPMSFENCRQFLSRSNSCTYLSYSYGFCSLHDLSEPSFQIKNDFFYGIVVKKLFAAIDNCSVTDSGKIAVVTAKKRFHRCIRKSNTEAEIIPVEKELPKLAIIISVTKSWAHRHRTGINSLVSNLKCYAQVHNYTFILNIMKDMTPSQFFHRRHVTMVKLHLNNYQHVLHLDSDSLVLNMSRSLDTYLQDPRLHVQLHLHDTMEVTASNYLVRNSHIGRCFMRYWAEYSPPHDKRSPAYFASFLTLNYDNGDLVSAVSELIGTRPLLNCLSDLPTPPNSTTPYMDTVVECFKRLLFHPTLAAGLSKQYPFLKIYLPRGGFWRPHSRLGRYSWWDELMGQCYPSSDVIGHGWKAMSRSYWNTSSASCDVVAYRHGHGGNQRCTWMTKQREIEVLTRYCAWTSSACWAGRGRVIPVEKGSNKSISSSSPYNTCLDECVARHRAVEKESRSSRNVTVMSAGEVDLSVGSAFVEASEVWMRNQMCASCPALFDHGGRVGEGGN